MNNVFAILELCAFYMEYKNAKLTEISFRGRNNVKYFMQTQLLRFCKDIAKVSSLLLKTLTSSTHFHLAKRKIPILWTELQTNKIQKLSIPYIQTPSGKKFGNCKDFFKKMWIKKQHNLSKSKLFSSSQQFSVYLLAQINAKK